MHCCCYSCVSSVSMSKHSLTTACWSWKSGVRHMEQSQTTQPKPACKQLAPTWAPPTWAKWMLSIVCSEIWWLLYGIIDAIVTDISLFLARSPGPQFMPVATAVPPACAVPHIWMWGFCGSSMPSVKSPATATFAKAPKIVAFVCSYLTGTHDPQWLPRFDPQIHNFRQFICLLCKMETIISLTS